MDKREAKSRAAAEKAYAKSQRNWFARHKILTGLGGLILLVIIISAASGGGGGGGGTETVDTEANPPANAPAAPKAPAPPKEDEAAKNVTVTSCDVNDLGGTKFADVGYTINNPTSKSSTYILTIAVIDSSGASVSQANGVEPNVLPGRPSQGKAQGNVSDSARGPYKCEVASVTRTAAN